jgi:hypothetical protein
MGDAIAAVGGLILCGIAAIWLVQWLIAGGKKTAEIAKKITTKDDSKAH